MFGSRKYNYEGFTKGILTRDLLADRSGGPKPGERVPDFRTRTLDGEEVALNDYRGKANVVLTLGSATCPFTAASMGAMNELYQDYRDHDDVQFLFLYVREAHPGERLPAHSTIADKLHAAEIFRSEEAVEMPILVDDLKGGIHKKYGRLPNPSYLIDKSGRVAFRCLWTRASVIEEALEELLQRQRERDVEHAIVHNGEDASMPYTYAMLHSHRALERGGRRAIQDFQREMGVPGRMAVTASRMLKPVADHPAKVAATVVITAGVVIGSLILGRYLRERRFGLRTPYEVESLGVPRRQSSQGDYEAVGI